MGSLMEHWRKPQWSTPSEATSGLSLCWRNRCSGCSKPVAISKLGNVDRFWRSRIGARKTPSVEIVLSHDSLFTDGVQGDVQPVTVD